MNIIRKFLCVIIVFACLSAVTLLHSEVAYAGDLVSQINQGKEAANSGGLGVIGIAMILAIAGAISLTIFQPTRRFGIALGVGLGIVVLGIIISKQTSIGETISNITNANNVTDILSE